MRGRPTSLRRRVTLSGVVVVTILVLALDVFVYLSLRDRMFSSLEGMLDARAQLAAGLAEELTPEEVSTRLDALGLRAIVRTATGQELRTENAPSYAELPAGSPPGAETLVARTVPHADGASITVLASRAGVDTTLDRLLLLEAIGTTVVVALAWFALRRSAVRVLRPIREVSSTARSIAGGRSERRLQVDDRADELADMADAFNHMLDELEAALARSRASEAVSRRFLADAAHQLRTPAAGIRASVGTLLRSEDETERERLLDNLARESARMSRLLSSLLRVARLDSGEVATRSSTIPLGEVVDELLERQRALAPHLRASVEGPAEAHVRGDPVMVREALSNLLDNAARHARSTVTVRVAHEGDQVTTRVEDDGPGIAPEDRERIFDRFVSLAGGDGSGLGLPIARGIAEAHGGSLDHEAGAFVLRLPGA